MHHLGNPWTKRHRLDVLHNSILNDIGGVVEDVEQRAKLIVSCFRYSVVHIACGKVLQGALQRSQRLCNKLCEEKRKATDRKYGEQTKCRHERNRGVQHAGYAFLIYAQENVTDLGFLKQDRGFEKKDISTITQRNGRHLHVGTLDDQVMLRRRAKLASNQI